MVFALSFLCHALAQEFEFEDVKGRGGTITGYKGNGGEVNIPEAIGGVPVWFIGYRAFADQTNITRITISDSVVFIEAAAFENCSALKSIYVGSGVSGMESPVFRRCPNLEEIEVDPLNLTYSSPEGVLISPLWGSLLKYPKGKPASYKVPKGIRYIADQAFAECLELEEVTLSEEPSVGIGDEAFRGCTNLRRANLGSTVNFIGSYAFLGCDGLSEITIPETVHDLRVGVFAGCRKLSQVHLPASMTQIGHSAFGGCAALEQIRLPSQLTWFGMSAFASCTALHRIEIPDTVTWVNYDVFRGCTALTNVQMGDGVTYILAGAFSECPRLETVRLSKNLSWISDASGNNPGPFEGDTNLKSVTFPAAFAYMGGRAFAGCTNLLAVAFEGDVPKTTLQPAFPDSPLATLFRRSDAAGWQGTDWTGPVVDWTPPAPYAAWSFAVGLQTRFPESAAEGDDPDADGVSNRAEYEAGTDPTESGSRFVIDLLPRPFDLSAADKTPIPEGRHAIYFRSVPGQSYALLGSDQPDGPWHASVSAVKALTTQTRLLARKPAAHPQAFFRVLAVP